jgi:hypothetical protein
MSPWFRVFGTNDTLLEPVAVVQSISALGVPARGKFHGSPDWFEGELIIDDAHSLLLERYLEGDNLGPALDSWIDWLETASDIRYHHWLLAHVRQTRQLFTLSQRAAAPGDAAMDPLVERVCAGLCRFLARETAGVYQVDGQGFFDADGLLLAGEDEDKPPEDDAEAGADDR